MKHADNSFGDREKHPEQCLLNPFCDLLHQLNPESRQSYFINELLCSNFGVTLGLAGAINRKMILINFVHDQIMNKSRYGKKETKKIVSP